MKQNRYDTLILKLIESSPSKCMVGMELSESIEKEFRISRAAAKKSVERAVKKGFIKNSDPLTFGKRQFAYRKASFSFSRKMFFELTQRWRPPLYRIMAQIKANKGIIPYYDAMKVGATLVRESKSKGATLNSLIIELRGMGYVERIRDQNGIDYLIDPDMMSKGQFLMEEQFVRMRIDSMLLYDIINFLKRQNLIDNSNVLYRDRRNPGYGIEHNNLVWDARAYTKTTGINTILATNSQREDKSVLVAMEVVVHREFGEMDLQGFYERVQTYRNSVKRNERKILPVLVFKEVSDLVFNRAQALGFMTIPLGAIYGERIFSIIEDLNYLKSSELNPTISPEDSIKRISEIIENIKKAGQEINLSNIIGDFFESLILQLLRKTYPGAKISQSKLIVDHRDPDGKNKFEYDFVIEDECEIVIVECKGYASDNTIPLGDVKSKNTVNWFFDRSFKSARDFYRKKDPGLPIKACFITSAQIEPEAIKKLEALNTGKVKPSELDIYFDGEKLLDFAAKKNLKTLIKTLKRYYY